MPSVRNKLKIIDETGLLKDVSGDVAEEIEEAIKRYKKFHWGIPFGKAFKFEMPSTPETVSGIGELAICGYVTQKKGDKEPTLYIHGFHNPPPILCADETGQLYVVGGVYTIEPRGIVH